MRRNHLTMSAYQLDLILDDLDHLETEHLPSKGSIAGVPCDCISKAGRSLRRHARETIPIAARQARETKVYSEVAPWAERIMEIGTVEAVASGQYDEEYLRDMETLPISGNNFNVFSRGKRE